MPPERAVNADRFDQQVGSLRTLAARLREQAGAGLLAAEDRARDVMLDAAARDLEEAAHDLQAAAMMLRHQYEALEDEQSHTELERRRIRSVFTSAACALLITDGNGSIDEANHAAAALLGLSPAYLARRPLAALIMPDDQFSFRRTLARVATTHEAASWSGRLQPRDRDPLQVEASVAPMADLSPPLSLIWSISPRELPLGHESGMALRRDFELRTLRRAAELGDAGRLHEQLLSALADDGQRLAAALSGAVSRLRRSLAGDGDLPDQTSLDGIATVAGDLAALCTDARALRPLRLSRALNLEPVNLTGLVTEAVAARDGLAASCTMAAPGTAMIGRWDRALLRYAVDAAISSVLRSPPAALLEIEIGYEERPDAGDAVLRISRRPTTEPEPPPAEPPPSPIAIGRSYPAGTRVSLTVAQTIIERHGGSISFAGERTPDHRALLRLPMDGSPG